MLSWSGKLLWSVAFCLGLVLLAGYFFPILAQEGFSEITIRTSSVEYDENTGKIVAPGASTIEWGEVVIRCPALEIDTEKRELKSTGEIDITWGEYQINASELFYQGEANRLWLEKVEGSGKEVVFAAPQVQIDFEARQLLAEGEVSFKLEPFELGCTKLVYSFQDRTWMAFEVHLSGEGWEGQAQRAVFKEGSPFISILGGAKIVKGNHSMVGDEILIYPETRKIQVKGEVSINIQP
ncbi:LptA/OstA family protein [Atrimonas thermophila]|jgi:hypothetical protein|uniref:LptA/OstA family protein n=1 Tax=Atrimonas thermophila TaxID=3064161 RepID=UPI00399C7019